MILSEIRPWMIILAISVILGYFVKKRQSERETEQRRRSQGPQAHQVAQRSEVPLGRIIVDAVRRNDPDGHIVVYPSFIVYNGMRIDKSQILNVTLSSPNAYPAGGYHLVIATNMPSLPYLNIPVGSDLAWAQNVAQDLANNLYH